MLSPTQLPLNQLLARARTAFMVANTHPEVAPRLAPYGYDTARIDALLDLVEDVEARRVDQMREYGEQFAATSALDTALGTLGATYSRHRQLARIPYKRGTDAYRMLRLDGRTPLGMEALAEQAEQFYRVLRDSTSLATPLAAYTLDAAALAEALAQVEAVRAARAAQTLETGEAQRATQLRDISVAELRGAYSDFVAVVKIALADVPQLRETLGLLERS